MIHLVNSVRDERRLPIHETAPRRRLRLEVDLDILPQKVRTYGDEAEVEWEFQDATLTARISGFSCHILLVIE